jgi:adenylate cyclase
MIQRARRGRLLALLCGSCVLCVALGYLFVTPVRNTEYRFYDFLARSGKKLPPDNRLLFVGIDQPSYGSDMIGADEAAGSTALQEMTNAWPWSRAVWGEAINKLASAGAKVIALDIVFSTQGKGDEVLAQAIAHNSNRVVLAANIFDVDSVRGEMRSISYPPESILIPESNGAWRDQHIGFVNQFSDEDGFVRSANFFLTPNESKGVLPPGATLKSFSARVVERFGEHGALSLAENEGKRFRFTGAPGFEVVPIVTLFLPEYWKNNYTNGEAFRDKVILIGPAANIFQDLHSTPVDLTMLGPALHLNLINAALNKGFIRQSSMLLDLLLIASGGALTWVLGVLVPGTWRRIGAVLCVAVGYFVVCRLSYDYGDFSLLLFSPLLSLGSSSLAAFGYEYFVERLERQRTRRTFEQYVSKDVVQEILDNPDTYLNAMGGTRQPVTCLFSDVRGFTTMSEGADPAKLVAQINEYFEEMVTIVFSEDGSLDKFIGDGMMALWGRILTKGVEQDAQHAVAAALAMKSALARLNSDWKQRGMMELAFGIGINHGEVLVGNIGAVARRELSVIGDAVNLASRLESLTKEYKLDLLLGESMVPLVQSRFVLRTVDSVQVKGKTKPVHVFTVAADKEAGEQPPPWIATYEEAVRLYRSRQFVEASVLFAECVQAVPEDYLSQLYVHRCQELITHPPSASWDTTFVMKSK